MIIDYREIKCLGCENMVLCDLHDCGCIFGKCECGLDIEKTDECKNNKRNIK